MKRLILIVLVLSSIINAKSWLVQFEPNQTLVPADQRLSIEYAIEQHRRTFPSLLVIEGSQSRFEAEDRARKRATEVADIALAYQVPRSLIRVLTSATRDEPTVYIHLLKNPNIASQQSIIER